MKLNSIFHRLNNEKPDHISLKKHLSKAFIIFIMGLFITGCSNLDVQTLNNKAAELMQKGDIDGAIARLESIQDLNPNFPQTNYNLGIAYKEKADYDKSIHYLDRAIELKPDFLEAHITLAVVYEELVEKLLQEEIKKAEKDHPEGISSVDDIQFSPEQKEKLISYYQKAKDNLEFYLINAPGSKDKDSLTAKITEFQEQINKYSSTETQQEN